MMHAKVLKSSWANSTGNSVECTALSKDGSQIGIGTDSSAFILDAKTGAQLSKIDTPSLYHPSSPTDMPSIGQPPNYKPQNMASPVSPLPPPHSQSQGSHEGKGAVTGLVFGRKGRIIVASQGWVRLWRIESQGLIDSLDVSDGSESGSVRLCLHPNGESVGAVCDTGRYIYILGLDLQIISQLVLLPKFGNIGELLWLSRSTILATSTDGLHIWRQKHSKKKPSLTLGQSIGLVTASASPETSSLASASRDGVVYIWTVEEDESADENDEALSADLRSTLKEYPCQVHPMCWDKNGRYLATADGPEATIWEVPRLLKESTQSTVCTGHDSSSKIVQAAFQEDGPMLATAANDGSVLIFNSDRFQPGKLSKPTACIQSDFGKDPVTSLLWIPGGKLVIGSGNGKLGMFSLSQPVPSQLSPKLSGLSVTDSNVLDVNIPKTEFSVFKGPGEESSPPLSNQNYIQGRKVHRIPSELPKSGHAGNGLTRQRSVSKGPGLLPKLSSQSMSERSSSFRSRDGIDFRREHGANLEGRRDERSWGSSLQNQPSLLSGDSLSDRSRSLKDNQPLSGTRNSSLERSGGLSPGLWQSIQNVGKKRSQSQVMAPREPAGWGQGQSNSMPGQQMPMQMSGPVPVPFSPNAQSQMAPGYMMLPNPALGPQYIPTQPGYPPQMAHMPMLAPHHITPPGVVDGSGMPTYPHQVMYMQVPHSMGPQPQWHQMVQGPWVGSYMVHPSQQNLQQKSSGVPSLARASSVPDESMGASWSQPRSPGDKTPRNGALQQSQEDIAHTNSISLPETTTAQWRERVKENATLDVQKAHKGEQNGAQIVTSSLHNKGGQFESDLGVKQQAGTSGADNDTIYVGNLAHNVAEQNLHKEFAKYGHITHTQVIRDKLTGVSRGFGFVSFVDPAAASKAIAEMNGTKCFGMFNSRSLKVSSSNRPAQGR